MTDAQSGGRAFFERQQRRRRELQTRLAGMTLSDQILVSEPEAAPPGEPGQAADSAPPEQESQGERRSRAERASRAERTNLAERTSRAKPESRAENQSGAGASASPEPESWTEPSALPEPETEAKAQPPLPEPALRLVVTDGPNMGQTFRLQSGELTIGREEGSDIKLDSKTVSHNHALVRRQGEVITIEDLRSTNGTKVNGGVISRPFPIAAGDRIMLGAVELLVEQYEADQRQK
jgi:hypothetical protein